MSRGPTEPLLAELGRDLRPVRPIPRLRTVLGALLLAWLVSVMLQAVLGGRLPMWGDVERLLQPTQLAVLAGLVATAAGALVASLAGAVPGREALARAGRLVTLLGVGCMLAGGFVGVVGAGLEAVSWRSLGCAVRACSLGLLPALGAGLFLARAGGARGVWVPALGGLGAVALGTVVVHASCAQSGATHLLVGHVVAPLVAAIGLGLALRRVVGRLAAV